LFASVGVASGLFVFNDTNYNYSNANTGNASHLFLKYFRDKNLAAWQKTTNSKGISRRKPNATPIKEALEKIPKTEFPFITIIKQQRFGSGSGKTFYFT